MSLSEIEEKGLPVSSSSATSASSSVVFPSSSSSVSLSSSSSVSLSSSSRVPPTWLTLSLSGGAGMTAWLPVHPMDLLKSRFQLNIEGGRAPLYSSISNAARTIYTQEGVAGLYSGLSAGIMRQATYTTLRAGLYQIFDQKLTIEYGVSSSFVTKAMCGLTSGAIASTICCPVELSLIRMQVDGRLPFSERRRYTGVVNAISRIAKEEGVAVLWRGSGPTILRAMVVNMIQLSSYDQTKGFLEKNFGINGFSNHFISSWTAGLLYCAASLPVDIAKTRMQNQKQINSEPLKYRNIIQTLNVIIKNEGVSSLWKGFLPYFGRGGVHTIIFFMVLEQMKQRANNFGYRY